MTTIGKHIAKVKCLRCSFSNIFCATENEFVQPSCVALNSQAFAIVIHPHRLYDCNHWDLCFLQFLTCVFCNLRFCRLQFCDSALGIHAALCLIAQIVISYEGEFLLSSPICTWSFQDLLNNGDDRSQT